jgi:uncharacterized protein YutE (UPF0331/DUF86 family)
MTKGKANKRVLADRLDWVDRMLSELRALPLGSLEEFMADKRNFGAAESSLRRALEALLDIGRHVLAKVFAVAVTEYKAIADELEARNILEPEAARRLRILAGYRNRMVHFYHEITPDELYDICSNELDDILIVRDAFSKWINANPHYINTTI